MQRLTNLGTAPMAGVALLVPVLAALQGCTASHPRGPHGPACEEITSASHIIEHPVQRFVILKKIAARPLSQHEQEYLVNAIFPVMAGGFGHDQADASVTLIRNPCCTRATCELIRERLKHRKMLGRDERRIITALEQWHARERAAQAGSAQAQAPPQGAGAPAQTPPQPAGAQPQAPPTSSAPRPATPPAPH